MNILQLCPKSPFPPTEGGSIAMKAIRDGLQLAGHRVHTFAISTPKITVDAATASKIADFSYAFLDTSVRTWPALRDLLLNRSYNISRFYSAEIEEKITTLFVQNSFDAVVLESVFMMPYFDAIQKVFAGPIVLRTHNLEYLIWQRVAYNTTSPLKKMYLKILARQLRHYEKNAFRKVTSVAAISSVDAAAIKLLSPEAQVAVVPFALSVSVEQLKEKTFSFRFGHIGSMDWQPNIEGISWLLSEVWPKVKEQVPEATFHLAGRNMPSQFQTSDAKGVFVQGEVEDAKQFMLSLDALIVPLLSGSGIRIKIAEAMSMGVPVITTSLGAEGLLVKNNEDIFLCDKANEMADTIVRLSSQVGLLVESGRNGTKTIASNHSPEAATALLLELFECPLKHES